MLRLAHLRDGPIMPLVPARRRAEGSSHNVQYGMWFLVFPKHSAAFNNPRRG